MFAYNKSIDNVFGNKKPMLFISPKSSKFEISINFKYINHNLYLAMDNFTYIFQAKIMEYLLFSIIETNQAKRQDINTFFSQRSNYRIIDFYFPQAYNNLPKVDQVLFKA